MTAPAAGYQHSPRPSYDRGTAVPRGRAARHVWGDAQSGEVLDLVYVSNDRIHQLLFEIPPGGQFTHSDEFQTVFGAAEVLYAVDGTVAVADPETGSVTRISPGEAIFFGAGTWHHAFNWGSGPARVLEFFAPPPATGTSGVYARHWIGYRGDAGGYVLAGGLALRLSGGGRGWDELAPGDGFFVPAGEQYQVRGLEPGVSSYLVGYAPTGGAPDPAGLGS